jgi:hypothetical protein
MSSFEFDYELIFTNTFDQTVIDNSDAPNKTPELTDLISQEVSKIVNILTIYPGVNSMSSFTTYDSKVFKVTLKTL